MMQESGENNMTTIRENNDLKNTIKHWKFIARDIHEPLNNNDYERDHSLKSQFQLMKLRKLISL